MNILFISPRYLPIFNKTNEGAIEKLERIYLKYNEDKGDHFTIYSPKIAPDNYDHPSLKNATFRNIDTTTPSYKIKKYLYAIKRRLERNRNSELYIREVIKDLKKRKEENAYNLIIFENGEMDIPIFRKLLKTKTKIILHLHNDYVNTELKDSEKITAATDEFWAVSKYISNRIKEVSKTANTKILYNTWSFESKQDKATTSKKAKKQTTTFLYVGRIREAKGVKELIIAFHKAYEKHKDIKLLIAGKAESDKETMSYFKNCKKLSEGLPIEFLGYIPPEKLSKIYSQADVQIVPSIGNEAFGIILLEGMSHNLPIIATDAGGIKEVGENLITYVNRDNLIKELTSTMIAATKNQPLPKGYYKTILTKFSEENYCKNFYSLIHEEKEVRTITISTFSKSENYGALLQTLALQTTLKKLGYIPSIIDYMPVADKKRYALIKTTSPKAFLKSLLLLPKNWSRKQSFKKTQKLLNFTKSATSNLAIAGSDQIWNPQLTGGTPDPIFFLEGFNVEKKIAYAISVGNQKNLKGNETLIEKYLKNFDKISVRETSAKTAITPLTDKDIAVTLDPTLLLKREEWQKIIQGIKNPLEGTDYILTYFIGGVTENQNSALTLVSKKLNLKVLSYSELPKEKNLLKHCYSDSPLEFLVKLRDAKLVLTSSFHGTVLSIILHKNFYYFLPNPEKRSRVDHILNLLDLNSRIIESRDDLKKITLKDIDYRGSDKKLDQLRQTSLDWLEAAINDQKAQPTPKAQSSKTHRPKTKPAQRNQK